MINNLRLLFYYIETRYTKILRIFGIKRDSSVIPDGVYCYVVDTERNIKEPIENGGYWIKKCKYYRSTPKTRGVACTYIGFYGFDFCLYDQCKICGKNDEIDECDLS